jgi:hypothetical protein
MSKCQAADILSVDLSYIYMLFVVVYICSEYGLKD